MAGSVRRTLDGEAGRLVVHLVGIPGAAFSPTVSKQNGSEDQPREDQYYLSDEDFLDEETPSTTAEVNMVLFT